MEIAELSKSGIMFSALKSKLRFKRSRSDLSVKAFSNHELKIALS